MHVSVIHNSSLADTGAHSIRNMTNSLSVEPEGFSIRVHGWAASS
jgi:hypothetical protein